MSKNGLQLSGVCQGEQIPCLYQGCPSLGPGCNSSQTNWCPEYKENAKLVSEGDGRRNGKCIICGWGDGHGVNCGLRFSGVSPVKK